MSLIDRAIYGKNSLDSVAQTAGNQAKYEAIQDLSDVVFGVSRNTKTNKTGEFSVDAFRASFADGIASPALFRFRLVGLPVFMQGLGVNQNVISLLPMRVRRSVLPDLALQTNPVSYYGVPSKFPYENSTGNLNLEVISSGNLWEREFFTAWQNYIIDYGTPNQNPTFDVAYYNDYVTSAELDVFNSEGEVVTTFLFSEVYPMTLTAVDMDWGSKDQPLIFSVELAYSYWSIKNSKSSISSTTKEKTSPLGAVIDAAKTLGVDKARKSIENLFN